MDRPKKLIGKIILIIGGARSGKSDFAQRLAKKISSKVLFIATAEALDKEMKKRISRHKKSRPKNWQTLEITYNIVKNLQNHDVQAEVIILDCLTLLVSNLLVNENKTSKLEYKAKSEIKDLIKYTKSENKNFIIVSNEVGLGIVPENKLSRDYRDILGKANQLVAKNADEIYFMLSGIPLRIK